MKYSAKCHCGEITVEMEHDPMMQFMCHCSICHQRIGTSISALAWPEHEINITGNLKFKKYFFKCMSVVALEIAYGVLGLKLKFFKTFAKVFH